MPDTIRLSPTQQKTFDWFISNWDLSNILHLWCADGMGRTTVMQAIHQVKGGVVVGLKEFVEVAKQGHPLALEDALYQVIIDALLKHDTVFVDDWHVATASVSGSCYHYPRNRYLNSPVGALTKYVQDSGKKLFITSENRLPHPLHSRCLPHPISEFQPSDYQFLCEQFGKEDYASKLDYGKIHRFAPKLNGYQLKNASIFCLRDADSSTDSFIEYLRTRQLTSNVQLGEVSEVTLKDLYGVDEVIESLMANIVVPFENDEISAQLGIKPKRGVLLAGPPGTGKTTVGRALAHRLKGKFFLIDGTVISGTRNFYEIIERVFAEAKENAPAVIFVDDSDVIFESGQEHGLYRYLLTMLDGLESKSVGRVCVILTAMDVANLPPALVRSGRIELWLDMRYPDVAARRGILADQVAKMPEPLNSVDVDAVAAASDGQSGADLKRILEEGKSFYAYDLIKHGKTNDPTAYMLAAINSINASKQKYAQAERRANANRTSRPTWFNPDLHSSR